MAEELQAVLSGDKKSMVVSRKDGAPLSGSVLGAISSYTGKAGIAAYQALKAAADVVEVVDPVFAQTMRDQALVYYTPGTAPPAVGPKG